jgi:hypothetical protein
LEKQAQHLSNRGQRGNAAINIDGLDKGISGRQAFSRLRKDTFPTDHPYRGVNAIKPRAYEIVLRNLTDIP